MVMILHFNTSSFTGGTTVSAPLIVSMDFVLFERFSYGVGRLALAFDVIWVVILQTVINQDSDVQ
jgi:hypothetical protein